MAEVRNLLARVPHFEVLPPETLDRLAAFLEERQFAVGAEIVKQGEAAGDFFLIISGRAEVRHPGLANSLRAGDFFGEMALLDGQPRSATVRAIEPVTCLVLPRQRFLDEVRSNPDLALALLKGLSLRIRDLQSDPLRVNVLREQGAGPSPLP